MSKKIFDKFAQGIFIVKSENSSFNSDFSGLPRRLPDENGTIYATDKALKYCIRKYLNDNGKTVFVWRRDDEKGDPITLEDNYKKFIEILKKENLLEEDYKIDKDEEKITILKNLLQSIDVRLFGVTFAKKSKKEGESKNVSVTGTTQLSYGINKLLDNLYYNNQILSPYLDEKEKGKNKQRTLGNETKTLEAHYVYDFIINPNNLIDDLEFMNKEERELSLLNYEDIENFKEATCKGVNYVNSCSKIGCEGELFLFIEIKTDKIKENDKFKGTILPLMKDLVKIEKVKGNKTEKVKGNKTEIDLSLLCEKIGNYKDDIIKIEIYYNPDFTTINGIEKLQALKPTIKNIVNLTEISH